MTKLYAENGTMASKICQPAPGKVFQRISGPYLYRAADHIPGFFRSFSCTHNRE